MLRSVELGGANKEQLKAPDLSLLAPLFSGVLSTLSVAPCI